MADWLAGAALAAATLTVLCGGDPAAWAVGAAGDLLIFAAYAAIPALAFGYARRRWRDLAPFRAAFLWCGAFIGLCGVAHLVHVVEPWLGSPWPLAALKLACAAVSVRTFFLLGPLLRHAERLPSPDALRASNDALAESNAALATSYDALAESNTALAARTLELEQREAARGVAVAAQAEAEERLRQSQKMEAIGQLTGGIAHDFNNMLQAMMGSVQLVRRKIDGPVPDREKIARLLDTAQDAGGKAARLTTQLLAFARRQRLDPQPMDPMEVVRGMMQVAKASAGDRIVLHEDFARGVGTCLADRGQLQQALLNLVNNARDAINEAGGAGAITVSLRAVEVAKAEKGGPAAGPYVCLSVRDDGPGMAEEVRARAFEPFFTTKPLGQGTGLGLATLYGFALQSRGWASIDSAPGRGAVVSLFLPRLGDKAKADEAAADGGGSAVEQASVPRETPPAAPGEAAVFAAGTRVLVVEDDPWVRMTLRDTLESWGCAVAEAETGPEALDALAARQGEPGAAVTAVLTDLAMPGMLAGAKFDGRNLVWACHERWPGLPLIMLSGNPNPPRAGDLPPGTIFLGKPYAPGELQRALASKLNAPNSEIPRGTPTLKADAFSTA